MKLLLCNSLVVICVSWIFWGNICIVSSNTPPPVASSDEETTHDYLKFFSIESQQILQNLLSNFKHLSNQAIWQEVKENIDEKHPFFFFHQRKSGGTALRDTLIRSANLLQLSYFVPCHKKISCDTYTLAKDRIYAINGGHFPWGEQSIFGRFHRPARSTFTCMTNLRNPIHRIESCLYFRYFSILEGYCLQDLPVQVLEELLLSLDDYGTSCQNEIFRIMSGERNELQIDHLLPTIQTSDLHVSENIQYNHVVQWLLNVSKIEIEKESLLGKDLSNIKVLREIFNLSLPIAAKLKINPNLQRKRSTTTPGMMKQLQEQHSLDFEAIASKKRLLASTTTGTSTTSSSLFYLPSSSIHIINQTLLHFQQCFPIIVEDQSTYDFVAQRIPALGELGAFRPEVHAQVGRLRNNCQPLQGSHLALLQRYASLEMTIYDTIYQKVLSMQSQAKKDKRSLQINRLSSLLSAWQEAPSPKSVDNIAAYNNSVLSEKIQQCEQFNTQVQRTEHSAPMLVIQRFGKAAVVTRSLLEQASGSPTGSIAPRSEFQLIFPSEAMCRQSLSALYVDADQMQLLRKVIQGGDQQNVLLGINDKTMKPRDVTKCRNNQIDTFEKVLVVITDPFYSIWSMVKIFPEKYLLKQLLIKDSSHDTKNTKQPIAITGNSSKLRKRIQLIDFLHQQQISMSIPNSFTKKKQLIRGKQASSTGEGIVTLTKFVADFLYTYYFSLFFERSVVLFFLEQNWKHLIAYVEQEMQGKFMNPINSVDLQDPVIAARVKELLTSLLSNPLVWTTWTQKTSVNNNNFLLKDKKHYKIVSSEALLEANFQLFQQNRKSVEVDKNLFKQVIDFSAFGKEEGNGERSSCAFVNNFSFSKQSIMSNIIQMKTFFLQQPQLFQVTKDIISENLKDLFLIFGGDQHETNVNHVLSSSISLLYRQ